MGLRYSVSTPCDNAGLYPLAVYCHQTAECKNVPTCDILSPYRALNVKCDIASQYLGCEKLYTASQCHTIMFTVRHVCLPEKRGVPVIPYAFTLWIGLPHGHMMRSRRRSAHSLRNGSHAGEPLTAGAPAASRHGAADTIRGETNVVTGKLDVLLGYERFQKGAEVLRPAAESVLHSRSTFCSFAPSCTPAAVCHNVKHGRQLDLFASPR